MRVQRKALCRAGGTAAIVLCFSLLLTGCGDGENEPQWDWSRTVSEEPSLKEDGFGVAVRPSADRSQADEDDNKKEEDSSAAEDIQGGEESADVEEEPLRITISCAGDVTLGNHKDQTYGYSFREVYDKQEDKGYFFANVKDIFEADDLTIVNLEGPLTLSEDFREGMTYNMRGDPEYANLLTLGSVEAVSMANNHRLDYKEQGSLDTVAALEKEGIIYAYDENTGIYETKGIRIGIVSVNEVEQGSGVEKYIKNGIASLREEGAGLILACCHWGTEREYYPEEYQTQLGRKCIDWGADLVIGHHPHVLQGIDCYQGKYIIYSLGNFCFGGNRNPEDKDTMIFQQTFEFTESGEVQPKEARVIPCSVSSIASRNNFQPTPLEGEEALRVIRRLNDYSKDYSVMVGEDGSISYLGDS